MSDPSASDFLAALARNTAALDALRAEVARLADEFKSLRASAPTMPQNDAGKMLGDAVIEQFGPVLGDLFGRGKKRKGSK